MSENAEPNSPATKPKRSPSSSEKSPSLAEANLRHEEMIKNKRETIAELKRYIETLEEDIKKHTCTIDQQKVKYQEELRLFETRLNLEEQRIKNQCDRELTSVTLKSVIDKDKMKEAHRTVSSMKNDLLEIGESFSSDYKQFIDEMKELKRVAGEAAVRLSEQYSKSASQSLQESISSNKDEIIRKCSRIVKSLNRVPSYFPGEFEVVDAGSVEILPPEPEVTEKHDAVAECSDHTTVLKPSPFLQGWLKENTRLFVA